MIFNERINYRDIEYHICMLEHCGALKLVKLEHKLMLFDEMIPNYTDIKTLE